MGWDGVLAEGGRERQGMEWDGRCAMGDRGAGEG